MRRRGDAERGDAEQLAFPARHLSASSRLRVSASSVFLTAILATLGCSTPRDEAVKSGARAVPASELRASLPGSMLRGRSVTYGLNVYLYLLRDGTAVVSFDLGAISTRYRITDDGLVCIWDLPPRQGETCWQLYQQGEEYKLFDESGDTNLVVTRLQGQDGHFFR